VSRHQALLERAKAFAPLAYAMDECLRFNIDPDDVLSAMAFGKREAIRCLSRALVAASKRRITAQKAAKKAGSGRGGYVRGGKHISPALVGFLAGKMLGRCAAGGWPPPAELVALLELHLEIAAFEARLSTGGYAAKLLAAEYVTRHPEASPQEIAQHVGVSRQAVEQWRKEPGFNEPLVRELLDPWPA
jgi:hypothetical protein